MKEVADTFAASPDPDLLRLEQLKHGLQDTFDTLKRLDEELIVRAAERWKGALGQWRRGINWRALRTEKFLWLIIYS